LDIHRGNILGTKPYLIDFGLSGSDVAEMDLANFAMYYGMTPKEEIIMLKCYYGAHHLDKHIKIYNTFRPFPYLNKVTYKLLKLYDKCKENGTPFDDIIKRKNNNGMVYSKMSFEELQKRFMNCVNWIYTGHKESINDSLAFMLISRAMYYKKLEMTIV
jgi:hypothetical protein